MENTINRPWDDYNRWAMGNEHLVSCEGYFTPVVIPVTVHLGKAYYYSPVMDTSLEGLNLDDVEQLFLQTETESGVDVSDSVEEKIEDAQIQKEYAAGARENLNSINLLGELFMLGSHTCLESEFYARYWLGTMNNALDALEYSLDEMENTVNGADYTHKELQKTGICDDDYTWSPKDACDNLTSAFLILGDESVIEGSYGKINVLYSNIYMLNDELEKDAPNTTLYYPMMERIWAEDGIISIFNELDENGKATKEEAKGIYQQYRDDAKLVKEYVDDKSKELKKEKLDEIDESVALAGESTIGTIAERYDTIEDEREDAEKAYERAENLFSNVLVQGYLKDATLNMSYAKESYESIEENIDLLEDDAEQVVDDAREEAQEKIDYAKARSSTMGSSGQEMLADAETAFENGDSADALGDKYEYYIDAAQLAVAALGEKSLAEEAEIQSKFVEIEDLLDRAEDDGINVAGERAELVMLENNQDMPDIAYRLDSLKSRIIGKAETIFSGLEDQREELLENLRLVGADDLIYDMQEAERGIVVNGRIDYENGLGRLSWLGSEYDSIAGQLEDDLEAMNELVANSIVTDTSLIIGKVRIDEPTDLSLNVLFMNTRDVGGEEVEVTVQVPGKFQFDYFDIVEGADEVSGLVVQGYKLKVTLKSIEDYGTVSVTFEKSQILASALSEEQSAVGLGDGSARVEESTVFDLEVDDVYIDVPEGASDVLVDGLTANRPLSKGVHTLSSSYLVEDAYTEERGETISRYTGETEITVTYPITLTPNIDLDTVPVVVDIGNTEQLTDFEISCVEYAYDVEGTRIDIFNLVEGSPATVQVSYTVSDLENYVRNELDRLAGLTEPELVVILEQAESMYSTGNYKLALSKVEEIKERISEIDKSKSKLIRKYSELVRDIDNEIEDLENAITRAEELNVTNSTLIDRFSSRKTELSEVLAGVENISSASTSVELQDAVDELEKIDSNWLKKQITAYKKEATKQLNDYRKDFVEFENETANEMLEVLEHDLNVLAATEKAESAVTVISDIEEIENMLDDLEEEQRIRIEELRLDFESLKEDVDDVLASYTSESKAAKGTSMEQLFTIKDSSVEKLVSDIEKYIGVKPVDYIEKKMKDLEKMKGKMEDVLDEMKKQAEGKLKSVKSVFLAKKDSLSEDDRNFISGELQQMEDLIAAGNYANAIAKGDAIVERINSPQENGNFLFLLLASLLVLAMIIIYMIRQQKPKKPKIRLEKEPEQEEKTSEA